MGSPYRRDGSSLTHTRACSRADDLADLRQNEDGSCAIHDLEEHLRAVGDL